MQICSCDPYLWEYCLDCTTLDGCPKEFFPAGAGEAVSMTDFKVGVRWTTENRSGVNKILSVAEYTNGNVLGYFLDDARWTYVSVDQGAWPGNSIELVAELTDIGEGPKAGAAENFKSKSAERKGIPLCTGVLDYFPAALEAVAKLSKAGNDKHAPGQPLHHARGKSMDHPDCLLRHLSERGEIDPETGLSHTVAVAWRALALLQEELEAAGAPKARGAR